MSGSRAYGTASSESDEDLRGVLAVPADAYRPLVSKPPPQLADPRGKTVYYSLRRTVEPQSVANPSLLELLFMPDDCVRIATAPMRRPIAARSLVVTQQCAETHAGHAMAQIRKARGQNKWISSPRPEAPPRAVAHRCGRCRSSGRVGILPSFMRRDARSTAFVVMWWDLICLVGDATQDPRLLEEVPRVLESLLAIEHPARQASAIHGLGHWSFHRPKAAAPVLERSIERAADAASPPATSSTSIQDELVTYARQARTGCIP